MSSWDRTAAAAAGAELERAAPAELLRWAMEQFQAPSLAMACGFGAEGMALLDFCSELGRYPRVFTLDTGRLPQQTYDLMERARRRYPDAAVQVYCPDASDLEDMVARRGPNLFYENVESRKLCCEIRKVRPLRRALHGCRAWITGLRRAHSEGRAQIGKVEWDETNSLVKINPLADWTDEQLWRRVREKDIPYNTLHDLGYPSVGCDPCTRPVQPGEDPRAGRWWWESDTQKECGLHRR